MNATVAVVGPVAVTAPIPGAPGDPGLVRIRGETKDGLLVPAAFVAVTVNVYVVQAVSPVTVIVPEPDWAREPVPPMGSEITVYFVIAEPPLDAGAVNVTVAVVDPVGVTSSILGAPRGPTVTCADVVDAAEVPFAFVAVTVNAYEVPAVSPVTVIVPDPAWDTVPVIAPVFEVAVYLVIAEPPLDAGAVNATVADVGPVAVTAPIPGAPGGPGMVTWADAEDAVEVPAAFVAVTVNAYEVPAASPVTVIVPDPAWVTVPVIPPVSEVAVYLVIGEPPLDAGAVNATVADVDPETFTAPMVGAPGTVTGVTGADGADADEVPPALVAVAVNVYAVPLVRPVTSQDPDSPVTVHVPAAGEAVTV